MTDGSCFNRQCGYAADKMSSVLWHLWKKHLHDPETYVADFGAGNGAFLQELNIRRKTRHQNATDRRTYVSHRSAIGFDLCPSKIHCLVCCDILQLEKISQYISKDELDVAVCTEVVEHMSYEDMEQLLRVIHTTLRRDGILLLTTPNDEDMSRNAIECPSCKHTFHRYGHKQRLNSLEMVSFIAKSGFHDVHVNVLPLGVMSLFPSWLQKPIGLIAAKFQQCLGGAYTNNIVISARKT